MFRRKGVNYDLNYLKEEDLNKKPTIERFINNIPQVANDATLINALYAVDDDAPPEVLNYFKNKAMKAHQKENEKYLPLLEIMKDVSTIKNNDLE